MLMIDGTKYAKHGQALIVKDDPQRLEEVTAADRNKADAPFQYVESLFAAPAAPTFSEAHADKDSFITTWATTTPGEPMTIPAG